jgi:hypothetical protein
MTISVHEGTEHGGFRDMVFFLSCLYVLGHSVQICAHAQQWFRICVMDKPDVRGLANVPGGDRREGPTSADPTGKDIMDAYCCEICKLEGHSEGIGFQHVPRNNNNMVADVLSKLDSKRALVPAGVFLKDLRKPSIKLLDSDNPDQVQPHPTLATPCDVLMTEKEDD